MEKSGKKRILFIDDEQKVLDGLKRMLYSMRQEWDMEFANSGKEALRLMKENPAAIVISDMRMPEMDGAELLNIVKKIYPHTIRFILSGYSDREMILRTIGAADQFLTKPCDPNILKENISRALDCYNSVDNINIRSFVSKIESLPTMPELYKQLKEMLESSTSSFKNIAEVISKDVSISAKILQLVNSSFFGLGGKIHSIQHAATYLGIETIKAIILTTEVFSKFTRDELNKFAIKKLYEHSIGTGTLTSGILNTTTSDRKIVETSIMAGMLHDVGKLIFIKNRPEEYEDIYKRSNSEGLPFYVLEKEHFGTTHAEVGGYLMSLWGLPAKIVKAISYHHKPSQYSLDTAFNIVTAVHVANVLQHEQMNKQKKGVSSKIDKKYLSELGMLEKLPEWREIAVKILKK